MKEIVVKLFLTAVQLGCLLLVPIFRLISLYLNCYLKSKINEISKEGILKIGISGPLKSGKTTLAKYLVLKHGFELFSISYPLKKISQCFFGHSLFNRNEKRFFLQNLGTILRLLYENSLILICLLRMSSSTKNLVIDDVRYPNEAYILKKSGFKLIRLVIDRDTLLRRILRFGESPDALKHKSEIALSNFEEWDFYVNTAQPLEKSLEKMDEIIEKLEKDLFLNKNYDSKNKP